MEPVTLRSLERILAVAIGGLCIYLGHRLFFHIPEQTQGEANLKLPGGISIFITRVGPGVFFALFGACVVSVSLYHGIVHFSETAEGGREFYGGFTAPETVGSPENVERERLALVLEFEFLNRLRSRLSTNLTGHDLKEMEQRVATIKLKLMKPLWGADWGDIEEFNWWAEGGAAEPVPKGLEAAATYYRSELEGMND